MTKPQIGLLILIPAVATIATISYLQYACRETHSSASADSRPESKETLQKIDPPVLKKHSTFKSYTTRFATYPSIRTFYRPHPHAESCPQSRIRSLCRLHSWPRRFPGPIRTTTGEPGQHCPLPWNRYAGLWAVQVLADLLGCLLIRSPFCVTQDSHRGAPD